MPPFKFVAPITLSLGLGRVTVPPPLNVSPIGGGAMTTVGGVVYCEPPLLPIEMPVIWVVPKVPSTVAVVPPAGAAENVTVGAQVIARAGRGDVDPDDRAARHDRGGRRRCRRRPRT